MYGPSIYNDVVPIIDEYLRKMRLPYLFHLVKISCQNDDLSFKFQKISKGHHVAMNGFQNINFCEVLEF